MLPINAPAFTFPTKTQFAPGARLSFAIPVDTWLVDHVMRNLPLAIMVPTGGGVVKSEHFTGPIAGDAVLKPADSVPLGGAGVGQPVTVPFPLMNWFVGV